MAASLCNRVICVTVDASPLTLYASLTPTETGNEMAIHRTVRTYNKARTICTIEHSMRMHTAKGSVDSEAFERLKEASNAVHMEIVEKSEPAGEGWELINSGGGAGGQDRRGFESTFWSKWERKI